MKRDEKELIRRIREGNTAEYEVLVRRYQAAVYHAIYQVVQQAAEAEELTQEVFVRAWQNLDGFHMQSRFLSWIYRIAINTAISHKKKEARFLHPHEMPEEGQGGDNPHQQMVQKEREGLLHDALAGLGENYRVVILMHYFEQLSYAEIATQLDLPEKTVKSRLFDARRILRDKLGPRL